MSCCKVVKCPAEAVGRILKLVGSFFRRPAEWLKAFPRDMWLVARFPFLKGRDEYGNAYGPLAPGTFLDDMPSGWRKSFGVQMCREIRAALRDAGIRPKDYRILEVKEKYGSLRWYDSGGCDETDRILEKYECVSYHTCVCCGRTAPYLSRGWIEPYCRECAEKTHAKYERRDDFYGWTQLKTGGNPE